MSDLPDSTTNPILTFTRLQRQVMAADMEALYFFVTLYRLGSIPEAAKVLAVSVSSANRLLAKLREMWGDPLFVRSGLTMVPTPLARDRYEPVLAVLGNMERLYRVEAIEPEQVRRTVRIACYDNAFAMVIGSMLKELRRALPRVVFQITQIDERFFDDLRGNHLDFAFFARQGVHPDIRSMPLITTRYVCVVEEGHPLEAVVAKQGFLEKADLLPYDQVMVNTQPERHRMANGPANGYFNPTDPSRIALIVPFFLAIPLCLQGSQAYAVVPERTARVTFTDSHLRFLPFSDQAPRLTTYLAWHERTQYDPVMQLIRATIKSTLQSALSADEQPNVASPAGAF